MGLAAGVRWRGARGLVSSSGGNAGYAVAWAGRPRRACHRRCTDHHRSPNARLIAEAGATVHVTGDAWDEAHAVAIT